MNRRLVAIVSLAVLVVVGAVVLLGRGRPAQASVPAPPPAAAAQPAVARGPDVIAIGKEAAAKNPIATETVRRTRLASDLLIVGSVSAHADHQAVVGPLVPGRVARLRAGPGDVVKAGEVLAEIESAEVGAAEADYISASARADAAERNLKRERALAEQRISSARDRELAEAEALAQAAQRRAAEERLRALGLRDADLAAIRAGRATGGRVPLRAPIAGIVVNRPVTLGQALERSADAFELLDLSKVRVQLDVYEKDLSRVRDGQQVQVRTESFPDQVFRGTVDLVSPVVDSQTRTATVRLSIDNPDGRLRPGQFVTARITGEPGVASTDALVVPRGAVQSVDGRAIVFVQVDGGFQRRPVTLGPSGGDQISVRDGLAEGERVATEGAFLLKSELLR